MSTDKRYIVLLRGINVGKNRKLPMADLRSICESVGCSGVSTYIQSGNVVLDSPLTADALISRLEPAIHAEVGFTPRVVVRRPAELAKLLTDHPFPDADEDHLHVGFMSAAPPKSAVAGLADVDYAPEAFEIKGKELYLYLPNGLGRSKLAAVPFERRLDVAITIRNWRTVTRLHEMASS